LEQQVALLKANTRVPTAAPQQHALAHIQRAVSPVTRIGIRVGKIDGGDAEFGSQLLRKGNMLVTVQDPYARDGLTTQYAADAAFIDQPMDGAEAAASMFRALMPPEVMSNPQEAARQAAKFALSTSVVTPLRRFPRLFGRQGPVAQDLIHKLHLHYCCVNMLVGDKPKHTGFCHPLHFPQLSCKPSLPYF